MAQPIDVPKKTNVCKQQQKCAYLWYISKRLVEFDVEAALVRHVFELHHIQIVQRLNAGLLKVV